MTPKVTFLPISQGNLRPTFLLHYEVHVGRLFIVPVCSSLQSSGDFHADYEGARAEPWKMTPGLQYLWICSPRGTLSTHVAASVFCHSHCWRWLGQYFGNEGRGAAGAQLQALTSTKQSSSVISSSVLDSSPICFRALGLQ